MPKTERRNRSRKGVAVLTSTDRKFFKETISAELTKSREIAIAHLAGITAEDHIADHAYVAPRRRFWDRMNSNVTAGFWDGVKNVTKVIIYIFGVTLVAAFLGSATSSTVREWVGVAMKALTGG